MATRRERVILDLEDHLSPGMLRAAAATKTLDKSLDGLGRSSASTSRGMSSVGTSASKASPEIDRLSGRLRLFRDIGITLGPAFAPIGAVAIPAVAGLAAQIGAATLAAGTAIVAFQGVGDALTAVNDAALEPTAENLDKAREALRQIGPEAREFVLQMQELRPVFDGLSDAAGAGIFPGLSAAFDQFESVAPRLESVLTAIGGATGDLVNDFATGLSGSRGMEFLDFIRDEVPGALSDLGRTVGNFSAGLAEMWKNFTPLNRDFSTWLLESSRAFDDWAQGLDETQGFQDFVGYVRENGPRVAEALGGIGDALVSIVTAVAPLGGPTLMIIEGIADSIAAVAGSDAGPAIMAAVTAMTLLGRSTQAFGKISESAWGQNMRGVNGGLNQLSAIVQTATRGGAAMAGFGLAMLDFGDSTTSAGQALETFTSVAGSALMGFAAGGPWGAALGTGIGLMSQMSAASAELKAELQAADDAIADLDVERMKQSMVALTPDALLGDESAAGKIRKLAGAIAATEGQLSGMAGILPSVNARSRDLAEIVGRQAEKMREARAATRDTAKSFIDLSQNADNAKVSLGQWLRMLERQAEALRDFRRNAQEAGEKGLRQGLIKDLQELGPVGALRMRQLANATDAEIRRANQAWQSGQEQIRKYTNEVGGVPTSKTTTINVAAGAALGILDLVRDQMRYLDGLTATTYVQTVQRGRVPGGVQEYAEGGWTGPGTKYQPAGVVHADEFVFSKEATHGNVAQLEALHRKLRGYADGGHVGERNAPTWHAAPAVTVGGPSVSVGGPNVKVFIDSTEVRAVVRSEQASADRFAGRLDDRD